jgi:cation diffusion facilitator CzcD-associated flavoprotein CzcO
MSKGDKHKGKIAGTLMKAARTPLLQLVWLASSCIDDQHKLESFGMNQDSHDENGTLGAVEHFDVLIVGAGISGIGSAYHLKHNCPGMHFVILDAHETYGGTWHIHRYPGTRSDSDLFTFGYGFKPWKGAPIATRAEILDYLGEVIEENQLGAHIRYRHTIRSASWSSEHSHWTIDAILGDSKKEVRLTANFLWMCQGYYRHSEGYTPKWPNMQSFKGKIVHPQRWPDDIDVAGQKVVVIGSGATAATLVPAIAQQCAHVTMLQRSPTYFATGRNADALCDELRKLQVNDMWIHEIMRRKIVNDRKEFMQRAHDQPEVVRQQLIAGVQAALGSDVPVDPNFTPRYRPLQQRVAFVPEADLFKAVRDGHASVVTGEIESFAETGIQLKSGESLDADIVVTATGFNICITGDIDFSMDGKPIYLSDTVTYRGMMFTGVPNMVWTFGYTFHSWTLRADLVAGFVCRLLKHMKDIQASRVSPRLRSKDQAMQIVPWVDPEEFNSGYLLRSHHLFPKRGTASEWRHNQDYSSECKEFAEIDLDDEVFYYFPR